MDPLDNIMDCAEAAQQWGTTQHYVKRLCMMGKVDARKLGKTWILRKDQPNPMRRTPAD